MALRSFQRFRAKILQGIAFKGSSPEVFLV
jgi:hypothetical protein